MDFNYFNFVLFLAVISYKKRPDKTEKGLAMFTFTILISNLALALSGLIPITFGSAAFYAIPLAAGNYNLSLLHEVVLTEA